MSRFKMPTAYHPSNVEWVRPIESLTSDGVRELQRLKTENAKLRELVLEVFACARRGAVCEKCKENNDGYACVYIMRDLGIEVDE